VRLRRGHPALRSGGFRWVHAGADVLLFLRETAEERILVQASRASHQAVAIDAAALRLDAPARPLIGDDGLRARDGRVTFPSEGPAFRAWSLDPSPSRGPAS
jgi:alpha-glucosidase